MAKDIRTLVTPGNGRDREGVSLRKAKGAAIRYFFIRAAVILVFMEATCGEVRFLSPSVGTFLFFGSAQNGAADAFMPYVATVKPLPTFLKGVRPLYGRGETCGEGRRKVFCNMLLCTGSEKDTGTYREEKLSGTEG